ncbi:serpin family protein [Trichothermofontia sp.]
MKRPQFGWLGWFCLLTGGLIQLRLSLPAIANPAPAPMSVLPKAYPSSQQVKLTRSQTRFGFQLFTTLLSSHPNQNLLISPTSVAIALSMLYNGATGETQRAIATALELTEMPLEEVNQANATLVQSLITHEPAVQTTLANSLWADQRLSLQPQFVQRMQSTYQARVGVLDFGNPNAVGTINQWVQAQTGGHIPQIISRIQVDEALFLLNAIFFKGQWAVKFDAAQTRDQPFALPNGQQRAYPFMVQTGTYRYYETPTFQAISLPYGEGHFSFDLFLPRPGVELAGFYRELTADNWRQWTQRMERHPGSLHLPRLRLGSDVTLNEALKTLGMGLAFDPYRANFAALTPQPAYVSRVKHKTFMELDETGTEATGVTAIGIGVRSAVMAIEPFTMVVDRPFFCVIRDSRTGAVLFMGSIVTPVE